MKSHLKSTMLALALIASVVKSGEPTPSAAVTPAR